VIDAAGLDEEQEAKLERELGRQYHILTRDDRLETVAKDIVRHFLGRGFQGKAMVVSIDKATALRLTGFDAPSCSTVYLDNPNHCSLRQLGFSVPLLTGFDRNQSQPKPFGWVFLAPFSSEPNPNWPESPRHCRRLATQLVLPEKK
jgi:hypothetical protein